MMGMKGAEEVANRYFAKDVTDRERAIFEGAIALSAVYHQFVGTPISKDEKVFRALEEAISRSIGLQPYKESVEVKINTNRIKSQKKHAFDYETLKGEHLDVRVTSRYRTARAILRMRYIPELRYMLMYVEKIEAVGKTRSSRTSTRNLR